MPLAYSTNPYLDATDPAPIAAALAWANEYDGACGSILKLSQGVPAEGPNEAFMARLGQEAADLDNAKYGDLSGEQKLREILAADVCESYECPDGVTSQNVAITAGCNMAAQVIIQTIAMSGDEIIVPIPFYFNHAMCLDMLGVKLRPLECQYDAKEGGYIPCVEKAASLIGPSTKAILLVSPNNPTGSVYSPSTLNAFFDLCQKAKIALIVDETYRDFVPVDKRPAHRLFSRPDWQSTLISLYSFSKSYAIPGHRVGAIIASSELLEDQISKVLDTMIICPPRAAQKTLEWAIPDPSQKAWRQGRAQELLDKGKLFLAVINSVNSRLAERWDTSQGDEPLVWEVNGLGGYYAFLKHPYGYLNMHAKEVGQALARHTGTICLPGEYFGQKDSMHLRVSISNVGVDGIKAFEDRLIALDDAIRTAMT